MQWLRPIFDRTPQDVIHADKNRGVPEPNRGARNYTDFKRIYSNLECLRKLFEYNAFPTEPLKGNEDIWTIDFFPRESDIDTVRQDVEYIRQFAERIGWLMPDTPDTPDLPWLSFQKLNDVEHIIFNIHLILTSPRMFTWQFESERGAF